MERLEKHKKAVIGIILKPKNVRTFSDYLVLWVDANAKNMSVGKFKEYTGWDFFDFEKKNDKETKQVWCDYGGFTNPETYDKGPKCNCKKQEQMEANAVQAKNTANPIPIRIWECPVHKHTFCHLKEHSEKSLNILNNYHE